MNNYNFPLIDNEDRSCYEMHIEKYIPQIEYMKSNKNEIFLTHTNVPTAIQDRGIGSYLVQKSLEDIERKKMLVVPMCPFVAAYIKKNPEWMRIVRN